MHSRHPFKAEQNSSFLTYFPAIWMTSLINRVLKGVQVGRGSKNGGISFTISQCDHGEQLKWSNNHMVKYQIFF